MVLLALLFASHGSVAAGQAGFMSRNQNPFLQIYGLPPFQSASLASDGEPRFWVALDIANHADDGGTAAETVLLDGESYFLTLSLRHRIRKWLEIGFDLPVVAHTPGIFDNAIERWHKIWGFSNAQRRRESNRLQIRYTQNGTPLYDQSSSAWGIGDLQLTAAVPLWGAERSDGRAVSMRSSLKLPTGDSSKLLGSGATDFALGLYGSSGGFGARQQFGITGFAGILLLGEGDVFPQIQESSVAFGGIAVTWQAAERLDLIAQFHAQGSYLNSELEELGGKSVQAAFGGTYRFRSQRTSLSLAVVEDLFDDATTDVALHISVNWLSGK